MRLSFLLAVLALALLCAGCDKDSTTEPGTSATDGTWTKMSSGLGSNYIYALHVALNGSGGTTQYYNSNSKYNLGLDSGVTYSTIDLVYYFLAS